jgi:hypothetical protein
MDTGDEAKRKQYPRGSWVGVGIAIGLPTGTAIGITMENLAIGAGIGLLAGIVIGSIFEARRPDEQQPDEKP